MQDQTSKQCIRCRQIFSLDRFRKQRHNKTGRQSTCIACMKADYAAKKTAAKAAAPPPLPPGVKRCGHCREVKPITDFHRVSPGAAKDGGYKDGLEYRCKQCVLKRHTARIEKLRLAPQRPVDFRVCSKCKETKPRSCFSMNRSQPDWLEPYCVDCAAINNVEKKKREYNRDYHLRRKYGLDAEQFQELLKSQSGRCAICARLLDLLVRRGEKRACIDHCHASKAVRGIVCGRCNIMLGFLEAEELDWRVKASAYLDRYKPT